MIDTDWSRPQVRIRAFRAIDDPLTCQRFVLGHEQVLTSIGVTKVSSSKNEWTLNPSVFVLVVESLDGEYLYGGARVHVAGGTQLLPIEQAITTLDFKIHKLIWDYNSDGTGELCGLWHSRELVGLGVGSIFLIRSAVALSYLIGIKSLFALCAPYTIKPGENVGMELEDSIGNKGTFYYPKLDLIATVLVLKDVTSLEKARIDDKAAIFNLRENNVIDRLEILRQKEIKISYNINFQEKWSLSKSIAEAKFLYKNILNK